MMNRFDLAAALIAIADTGSVKLAAEKLHQSSAAVSKKLMKLERALATQLVKRQRKGMILTESGQRYYYQAKQAIAQLYIAEYMANQQLDKPVGKLRVVAPQYYVENHLLPDLGDFLTAYPGIQLTLEVAEILPDFNTKHMDILYGVSVAGSENLVRKKIAETRYTIAASPSYFAHKPLPQSPTELLQFDFISHSNRHASQLINLDKEQQILVKPRLLCNNTSTTIQAALAGLGFIWVHENMVQQYLQTKRLIPLLPEFTQQIINIYVYYLYQPYPDPKVKAFIDFFTKSSSKET